MGLLSAITDPWFFSKVATIGLTSFGIDFNKTDRQLDGQLFDLCKSHKEKESSKYEAAVACLVRHIQENKISARISLDVIRYAVIIDGWTAEGKLPSNVRDKFSNDVELLNQTKRKGISVTSEPNSFAANPMLDTEIFDKTQAITDIFAKALRLSASVSGGVVEKDNRFFAVMYGFADFHGQEKGLSIQETLFKEMHKGIIKRKDTEENIHRMVNSSRKEHLHHLITEAGQALYLIHSKKADPITAMGRLVEMYYLTEPDN
jgi:hypothetical protein